MASVTLALCGLSPSARADGDPASDVLVGQSVFYPYSSTVSPRLQRALNAEVAAAGRAHFPLKVALVASPVDLGSATALFGKPQDYAAFLGAEITFVNVAPRLLVVMPNGYGMRNLGPAATAVAATLGKPAGASGDDLALAAIAALPKLAAATGHRIGSPGNAPSGQGGSTTLKLVVLVVVALVVAGALVAFRRRRQPSAGGPGRAGPLGCGDLAEAGLARRTEVRIAYRTSFRSAFNADQGERDGHGALEEFTELRWITVQSLPRQYPI